MIMYWDNVELCNRLGQGLTWHPHDSREWMWRFFDIEHRVKTPITDAGIWYTTLGGKRIFINNREGRTNVIEHGLPAHVLEAMQHKKLIVVLDNSTEGQEYTSGMFWRMHLTMERHGLPNNSLVIITGAWGQHEQYLKWCRERGEQPRAIFSYAPCSLDAPGEKQPTMPIVKAMNNPDAKDYLSLNQTVKVHRLEHVYWLIKNNILDKGLVSASHIREGSMQVGHWNVGKSMTFMPEVSLEEFKLHMSKNLPLHVDGDWTEVHPDTANLGYYNRVLHENSLLYFITESEFVQNIPFITEKTLKAFSSGQPFIMLNGPGALEQLNTMGFKTELCGIDTAYDAVQDPVARFTMANQELLKWCNLTREQQIAKIQDSMQDLEHNYELVYKTFPGINLDNLAMSEHQHGRAQRSELVQQIDAIFEYWGQ